MNARSHDIKENVPLVPSNKTQTLIIYILTLEFYAIWLLEHSEFWQTKLPKDIHPIQLRLRPSLLQKLTLSSSHRGHLGSDLGHCTCLLLSSLRTIVKSRWTNFKTDQYARAKIPTMFKSTTFLVVWSIQQVHGSLIQPLNLVLVDNSRLIFGGNWP